MPATVRRQNAAAMVSIEGNSRGGKVPGVRHDLPDRADDEERKHVAPHHAPARLALRDVAEAECRIRHAADHAGHAMHRQAGSKPHAECLCMGLFFNFFQAASGMRICVRCTALSSDETGRPLLPRHPHADSIAAKRAGGGTRNVEGTDGQTHIPCRHRRRACDAGHHAFAGAGLSGPSGDAGQSVPARRGGRCGRPSVRRCARAVAQAAGGGRDQVRRGRRGRRAVRRQCQAGRLHAARAPAVDLGLRRGGQAVRPHAEIHPRRLHSDRAADRRPDGARGQRPGAVQDAEGIRRRRQAEPEQADLLVLRPLRRAASARRADDQGRRHPVEAPADRRRRAGR